METRLIVCGGRDFDDYEFFTSKMDRLMLYYENIRLISSHASGADRFAEQYAKEKNVPIMVIPADWKKHGRAAGPIRNRAMLDYAKKETPVVAAFWDGKSKGTGNMLKQAKAAGAECNIFFYEDRGDSYEISECNDQW